MTHEQLNEMEGHLKAIKTECDRLNSSEKNLMGALHNTRLVLTQMTDKVLALEKDKLELMEALEDIRDFYPSQHDSPTESETLIMVARFAQSRAREAINKTRHTNH